MGLVFVLAGKRIKIKINWPEQQLYFHIKLQPDTINMSLRRVMLEHQCENGQRTQPYVSVQSALELLEPVSVV